MKNLAIILLPIFICTLGCKKNSESEIPTGWQESMSGKILFSRQLSINTSRLYYFDLSGLNDVTPVGNEYEEIYGASWSPDGSQVVFTYYKKQVRNSLNIINSDGTNEKTIWQKERGMCRDGPVWINDTNLIAFVTYNDNYGIIQITNSMGDSLQSYRVYDGYSPLHGISKLKRSPHNMAITYYNRSTKNSIWELDLSTHYYHEFYEFPDSSYSSYNASFTKDGKSIACAYNTELWKYHILILDVQGGEIIHDIDLTQSNLLLFDLSWSPDGKMLALALSNDHWGGISMQGILIIDIHGNRVTHLISGDIRSVEWY